jgi:antitoxin MazE
MRTKLKKIGNSKGITLPKSLLEQYQFEEEVEIVTLAGGLLVMPVKAKPREEWEKQFKMQCWKDSQINSIKKTGHGNKAV